jgi:hypothetical protein
MTERSGAAFIVEPRLRSPRPRVPRRQDRCGDGAGFEQHGLDSYRVQFAAERVGQSDQPGLEAA